MDLTIEMMKSLFSPRDYTAGLTYALEGRVRNLKIEEVNIGEKVTCEVQGSEAYVYDVSFHCLGGGHFIVSCDCPQCYRAGICKHVAAAMFACLRGAEKKPRKRRPESDYCARLLLNRYLERRQRPQPEQPGSARLVPRVSGYNMTRWSHPVFSFRVGREKLYVVKNVRDFLKSVRDGETVAYGKKFSMNHNIDEFDAQSQAIIRLLMNEFPELLGHERYGYYDGESNTVMVRGYPGNQYSLICLQGEAFNQMFELLKGQTLELSSGGEVRFEERDPEVTVSLKRNGEAAALRIQRDRSLCFFGSAQTLYAKTECEILRCSRSFQEQVYPLLLDTKEEIQLSMADLPTFCGCVLPVIQDAVEIDDPEELLQAYLPDDCTPCFYFDIQEDELLLELRFRYGSEEFSEEQLDKGQKSIKRDVLTEQAALTRIDRDFSQSGARFVLRGEDAIFTFLTEKLDSFRELGDVYLSERLQRKRIRPSGTAVGISVSEGLLTLELDTGEFPPEELEQLYQSLLQRKKYHRLKDGRYLELDGSSYEKLAEMSHMLQLSPKELKKGSVTLPAFRGLYLDGLLTDSEGIQIDRDQSFRAMVRSFKALSESDYAVPAGLEHTLRSYQKRGFQWLKTLESSGFGGILADEMGLGKTLEVIAYFASLDRAQTKNPCLVVCPASLILNWGEELARFVPQLRTLLVMGTAAERKALLKNGADADIWVTSYELLRQDIAQYQSREFYCCVLDEGQHIKNQSTLASKAVKKLNCRQRFVLTGTPIENRLSELWNLFDFLMPGYLFSHSAFVEKLEKPIVKSKNPEAAEQLRRLVQPFMLRRLKKDVLKELPDKLEYTRRIALSETERKTYQAAANAAKNAMGEGQGKLKILAALTQLRQICCDPNLCFENYQGETSKLEACLELCAGMVENGHQILLFSQFTSMLDRIRQGLEELHISSFTLQGSTPKKKRAQLVKDFNSGGASVFLISLKAGGTGLNLTAADVVIHYDPWWNLAAQNQATDRAHRIGQRSNVQVYKLIAKDTIEEKILELQEKKAALMDTFAGDLEGGILTMSREELLALLD